VETSFRNKAELRMAHGSPLEKPKLPGEAVENRTTSM